MEVPWNHQFILFFLIINLFIITLIIIQFVYDIIPIIALLYGSFTFIILLIFYVMIQKQDYNISGIILNLFNCITYKRTGKIYIDLSED